MKRTIYIFLIIAIGLWLYGCSAPDENVQQTHATTVPTTVPPTETRLPAYLDPLYIYGPIYEGAATSIPYEVVETIEISASGIFSGEGYYDSSFFAMLPSLQRNTSVMTVLEQQELCVKVLQELQLQGRYSSYMPASVVYGETDAILEFCYCPESQLGQTTLGGTMLLVYVDASNGSFIDADVVSWE